MKMTPAECQALYTRAHKAGVEAAMACKPMPMVVTQYADPFNKNSAVIYREVIEDGVCGFAWVVVRPGNSSFARWLKKNGLAQTGYDGGVHIWISAFNQSMQKKEAYATAMAKIFRENGINAYSDSRMD